MPASPGSRAVRWPATRTRWPANGPPRHLGALADASGKPLAIDGLWALAAAPNGTLFFTAGPAGEKHGAFGTLSPLP